MCHIPIKNYWFLLFIDCSQIQLKNEIISQYVAKTLLVILAPPTAPSLRVILHNYSFSSNGPKLVLFLYNLNEEWQRHIFAWFSLQATELVTALQDLENSASSDAGVREKIAALPPEVSDLSKVEKITGQFC